MLLEITVTIIVRVSNYRPLQTCDAIKVKTTSVVTDAYTAIILGVLALIVLYSAIAIATI